MAHAARWLEERGELPPELCCIYPTAPFVTARDLQQGLDILRQGTWSYVISATSYDAPVHRAFQLNQNRGIQMLFPQHVQTRSQDLPQTLHDAAQFYWGRSEAWRHHRPGLGLDSTALIIPHWRVQDIDNEEDWRRAELMASAILLEKTA